MFCLAIITFFGNWWEALSSGQQFYWGVAILATFALILQLILAFIGGDFEGEAGDFADVGDVGDIGDVGDVGDASDVDFDSHNAADHHDSDLKLLSIKSITAFFLGFGLTGIILMKWGVNGIIAALPAIIIGIIMMFIIYRTMIAFTRLTEKGNISIYNCVGTYGTVYLPVPANLAGKGKVQVVVQERMREFDAVTEAGEKISNNKKILVVDVKEDSLLLVKPV